MSSAWIRSATASATARLPVAVGPKSATTVTAAVRRRDRELRSASVVDVARSIRTVDELAGCGVAGEVHRRVAARAAAQERRIGPARALDEHLLDAADTLVVAPRAHALDELDESLDPLELHLVRNLIGHRRRVGAGARRVDERERAVEADLLDDLDRLAEVVLGLAREADDDVGREREVGDRRAQRSGESEIALAASTCGASPSGSRVEPDWSGRCACSHTAPHSAIASITGARKSFGCGLVKRIRSMPSTASQARSSSPNSVRMSGTRSRPHELTFCPSSVISRTPSPASAATSARISPGRRRLLPAAHRRDDAVRARRVAAHRDLHPGLERPLAVRRQRRGERAVSMPKRATRDAEPPGAEPLAEMRDRARAERDVDLGIELEDPFALRLGVAAADGDHRSGVARFRALASPRYAASFVSGFSRIVHVLKTTTSASAAVGASPSPSSSSMPLIRSES